MYLLELFQTDHIAFVAIIGLIALAVGSFLNVVIYRLPVMMEKEYVDECMAYLASRGSSQPEQTESNVEKSPEHPEQERFDLVMPRSRCPHCGHMITALENIPVLSFIFLKGKCSSCGAKISIRYPVIEMTTAILSIIVAWHFGYGWQAASALLLTWALISLSMIDYDHQLLPDSITLPFLWLGIILSLFEINPHVDLRASVVGAIAGYLVLWSVYKLFKLVTGKEGMGYGDFKLLALLGAWMGWQALPVIIILSSLTGAVIGMGLIIAFGRDRNIPIPFGPYLAIAGWINLLWGGQITEVYFRWSGL